MTPSSRAPSESIVVSHVLTLPEHANPMGHVHGGWIMKLVDEMGGLAAMRHGRRVVVTAAVESMVFHRPVRVGSFLQLEAKVVFVGRTSIEVEVLVSHEDPVQNTTELVHTARMVYVALDEDGRPAVVPALDPTTLEEKKAFQVALEKKAIRTAKV